MRIPSSSGYACLRCALICCGDQRSLSKRSASFSSRTSCANCGFRGRVALRTARSSAREERYVARPPFALTPREIVDVACPSRDAILRSNVPSFNPRQGQFAKFPESVGVAGLPASHTVSCSGPRPGRSCFRASPAMMRVGNRYARRTDRALSGAKSPSRSDCSRCCQDRSACTARPASRG